MALAVCSIALAAMGAELAPTDDQEYVERYMARFFPRQHLTQMAVDNTLSERIWNNFINALDYERIFFVQSDIESFRKDTDTLDEAMKAGDMSFAFRVYEVFRERLLNRCAYVQTLIKNEWNFDEKESYKWKRKDSPWPADEAEWDDIWRKRIKNEFLRQRVSEILKEESPEPQDAGSTSTNSTDEAKVNVKPPTVAEIIEKRYERLKTIIEDNDADYVVERFLTAFASAYDPHSSYLSPASAEDFDIEMKLSLVGIGAVLEAEDGAAKVVRLIPGGPASRDKSDKRLREGDKIIAVGQANEPIVDTLHWPLAKIVQKIRGEKGSRVILVVIPASDPSGSTTKTVELIRDEVKLEEQAVKWTLHTVTDTEGRERRLALIDIPAFYANLRASRDDDDYRSSADDVAKALDEIATNNVDAVAIDLRNNGGGSLVDSVRMTGLFITDGPVVQVKESASQGRILTDDDPGIAYDGPLLVMVNRLSASASEILAAALKDYGRAVIVGDSRTHGKGTVQTVVNVGKNPEFGAIKLTTAVFYRITGDSTQLRGVIPDIYIPSPYDYMELGEDSLKYPVEWNRIQASRFRPFADLSSMLTELRERSDRRREQSEEFRVYGDLLEQARKLYESEEIPLDLDSRLKQSRSEKKIFDMQRKLAEKLDDEESKEAEDGKDLMLQESLKILADMVSLQPVGSDLNVPPDHPDDDNMMKKIKGWLRSAE